MKDVRFTIITCSYNTPIITECLLKSYIKYHPGIHRIIIIENSTNNKTRKILNKNAIPFIDGNKILTKPKKHNWAWNHYCGLDWAIQKCITPYCLILDTDILFRDSITEYFENFTSISDDVVAAGIHLKRSKPTPQDNYYMLPRIHPAFMLLDVNFFNDNNLTFDPYVDHPVEVNECYDVGSYLFMMIHELGKRTIPINPADKPFIHCEGLSWAKEDNKEKLDIYDTVVYNDLSDIDIKNKFILEINDENRN